MNRISLEEQLFPIIALEESLCGEPQCEASGEEGFDRGEPLAWIGTICLFSRIGGSPCAGKASLFTGERELFFHEGGQAPGAIDEEKVPSGICWGEGRGPYFKEEAMGHVGQRIGRIGIKREAWFSF